MPHSGRLIFTLARKFLLSKSSDGFIALISWVSVLGVALGVMALTLVTSVINGFEGELARVITGMNGDVLVYTRGEPFRSSLDIESELRKVAPEIQALSASFVTEIMVSGKTAVSGGVIQGIQRDQIGEVTQIPKRVISGRLPSSSGEVALGYSLAERLGVGLGDEVKLIIPSVEEPTRTQKSLAVPLAQPKAMPARIVGLVKMGMHDYDSKFLFLTLESVQSFLNQPGAVTTFHLKLKAGVNAREISKKLSAEFGYPFRAKDWSALNKNLFYAIELEKVVIAIILAVIVIVAAFNVVSTLMMMIHDKTKEIGILKAMGFRPAQSFLLFCVLGLGIGLVGTSLGVLGGLVLGWILEKTHWISLPPDIYSIGFLPVLVRWSELGMIIGFALLVSFLATLYPAWRVSKNSPLDGLRYE